MSYKLPRLKIGRNDLCLCGSGNKFKKCCIGIPFENRKQPLQIEVAKELKLKVKEERKRQDKYTKAYGSFPRPVFCDSPGGKLVAIGSKLFKVQKDESFHKFLLDNLMRLVDPEWFQREVKLKNNKHPLINWFQNNKSNKRYYLQIISVAFDLYVIENNADLQNKIIVKLKNKDQFYGARSELLCASICIRAGLEIIKFYDESLGDSCAEFIVRDPESNFLFDLESKRSHATRNNYGSLINQSLKKIKKNPLVIFIDLNTTRYNAAHITSDDKKITQILKPIKKSQDGKDLYSLVVFLNDPYEDIQNEYLPNSCAILPDHPNFESFPEKTFEKIKKGVSLMRNIPEDFN